MTRFEAVEITAQQAWFLAEHLHAGSFPWKLAITAPYFDPAERDEQHRRIGRVDLAVRGQLRELLRQLALRAQQRGLHVDRGGIDVAAADELERERGHALRVDRADGL